jgi:HEAT repeat protein
MDLGGSGRKSVPAEEARLGLAELMERLGMAGDNRREVYALVDQFPGHGEAGKDSLLSLADSPNPLVREFAIQQLGQMGVLEAEDVMIRSLHDSIIRVRSSAILALGQIKSERAAGSLASLLTTPLQSNNIFHVYGALGAIGHPDVIPVLAEGLEDGAFYNQIAALDAIMKIDPGSGLTYAISELKDENVDVRRNAVIVCIQSGDKRAIDPLKPLYGDDDFETRFYARQGVKKLEKN